MSVDSLSSEAAERYSNVQYPWIIPTEQVIADRNTPLGPVRKSSNAFRGSWNGNVVAVKILQKETPVEAFRNRIELWTSLQNENILRIFGASPADADPPFIVTEFHPDGNVKQFLDRCPNADREALVAETALGMQYLHARGLSHGGLKPTNILITEGKKACIADYCMVEIQPSCNQSSHRYYSPEAWKGTVSRPSDVYAFAMCAFEIFTSTPPWGVLSETRIFQLVVREDSRPDRPDDELCQRVGLTDQIWGIMEEAWHKEPRLRPSFDHILNMWVSPRAGHPVQFSVADEQDGMESLRVRIPELQARGSVRSVLTGPPAYDTGSIQSLPPLRPPPPASASQPSSATVSHQHLFSPVQASHTARDCNQHSASLPVTPSLISPLSDPRVSVVSRSTEGHVSRPHSISPNNVTIYDGVRPLSTKSWSEPKSSILISHQPPSQYSRDRSLNNPHDSQPTSAQTPRSPQPFNLSITSIDEAGASHHSPREQYYHPRLVSPPSASGHDSVGSSWEPPQTVTAVSDSQSITSNSRDSQWGSYNTNSNSGPSAVLLAGALQAEVTHGRKCEIINSHLNRVQQLALQSDKDAQKLVTAGVIPTLILLLKARAVDGFGLENVLLSLGVLAHDCISANTIYRTSTASILIEIFNAMLSDDIAALSIWCINRICRNSEVAAGLVKQDLGTLLLMKGLRAARSTSRLSAWCLGSLLCTDALADILAAQNLIPMAVDYLRRVTESPNAEPEDVCAALYVVARASRSIKLAKALAKAGCVEHIARCLHTSEHSQILNWSARAVGCLMRPNSGDMAKTLLDAGIARGLARMPRVLPTEEIAPLASFAFAIQRFSCAEWGGGTRKALVNAGVVDSLLAALRTAADMPNPQVHIELALAVSFLGDVGGSAIRKEIVNAGGITILKRVAAVGKPDVAKACNMAATSTTGNLWTRNAVSAKIALAHNWSGGCPDYQPPCPLTLADQERLTYIS